LTSTQEALARASADLARQTSATSDTEKREHEIRVENAALKVRAEKAEASLEDYKKRDSEYRNSESQLRGESSNWQRVAQESSKRATEADAEVKRLAQKVHDLDALIAALMRERDDVFQPSLKSLEQEAKVARADAERAIGASRSDLMELKALSRRYHELEPIAAGLGLEEGHHRELYRQALRSKDVATGVHRLKDAVEALERSTSTVLPSLEIRSSTLFNRGSAPALNVQLDGNGSPFEAILWPHRETALPPELLAKGRMALSYRALFLPRPFLAVLEPTG
jgi:archaellum component FlaC